MNIHYLQHVPFEGLAIIDEWIQRKSHATSCTALYQDAHFPQQADFDALIIMGGPMGVADENQYPWILPEKRFIEQTIKADKIVIGICLGAQMIAKVLGAKVYPGAFKEIGWFPVKKTEQHTLIDSIWPDEFYAFHWHGDTFEIPAGATHFASSAACNHQGFIFQQKVFGFQFHLESTPQSIEQLILNCGHELEEESPYIQTADTIRAGEAHIAAGNRYMQSFLDGIL